MMWIASAPNATFPTSGGRLPASRGLASSTVPELPTHGFPILSGRFHHYLDLLLEQPCGARSQLFGVATKHPPFKLVFVFDFHIGRNYSHHLFMNINSRYSVGHSSCWPGAGNVLRLP